MPESGYNTCKISHEKDGRQWWPHSFNFPATGSATHYFGLSIVHNHKYVQIAYFKI